LIKVKFWRNARQIDLNPSLCILCMRIDNSTRFGLALVTCSCRCGSIQLILQESHFMFGDAGGKVFLQPLLLLLHAFAAGGDARSSGGAAGSSSTCVREEGSIPEASAGGSVNEHKCQ
jgi:hypothetical protein